MPDAALDYGDHHGRPELRRALAAYLGRTRGVRIDPGRIVVTQGFTQALYLLCRVLADRGASTIVVESPSHLDLRTTIRTSGLTPAGCPVDVDGVRTADLHRLDADAVVVAPAHQFPAGAVLALARRVALIRWAATRAAVVIEDDYDAEFRYDRSPIGAVQGLDPGRVAHVGTASKALAPGIRLGWVSLPAGLVDDVRELKGVTDSGSPIADQLALAELLTTGAYERQVVRARHVYRRRRDQLVRALSAKVPRLSIMGAAAGMQLLLRLADGEDDVAIAKAAAGYGIGVGARSPLHLSPSPIRGLLLGYGQLPEPRITAAVDALAAVLSS